MIINKPVRAEDRAVGCCFSDVSVCSLIFEFAKTSGVGGGGGEMVKFLDTPSVCEILH